MHRLNLLFTFSSISVLLVTIERFSFTTKVLLEPNSFFRLHEIVQMTVLIFLTVLIPTLLLKEITQNFKNLKQKDFLLLLLFISGVYFYATGNGVHELASFMFNHYCNVNNYAGNLCGGLFFNDYYTGNVYYFIGAFMMIASLLLLELRHPSETFKKNDLIVLTINALIYSLAIFVYAAFDRVSVGITYSVITSVFAIFVFLQVRTRYLRFPVITYTTITYLVGTITALIVRYGL